MSIENKNENLVLINRSKRYFNSVTVYDRAVKYHRIPTYDCRIAGRQPSKRSKITYFSRHSRLRLREAIAKNHISNSSCYGLTLTLPWKDFNDNKFVRDFLNWNDDNITNIYQECFNRFTLNFRRRFPNSGCIFRHELQQRKIPHCHLIVYVSNIDLDHSVDALKASVLPLWWSALQGQFFGGDQIGFFKYGIHAEKLTDNLSMFRYLADHSSKSKQAQSGYIGKHWGFINKKLFQLVDPLKINFADEKSRVFFSRHISKVCRFSISFDRWSKSRNKIPRVDHFSRFGSIKVKRNDVSGFRFVHRKTIFPLVRYMCSHSMIK